MSDAEQVIAARLHVGCNYPYDEQGCPCRVTALVICSDLRTAGLLPSPDDIVVSREALQLMWRYTCDHVARNPALGMPVLPPDVRAALSQPHPAQEQQT
jgi:hypothetical protein